MSSFFTNLNGVEGVVGSVRYGLLMAIGALFAVLGFLFCRAAAVCAGDVFLFLRLCLYFAVILRALSAAPEVDAVL